MSSAETVNVRVDPELRERLEEEASRRSEPWKEVTVSDVVREGLYQVVG